jgi:hypothetical protein
MIDNFQVNAAWELKESSIPCRWFIVWKDVSKDEFAGYIAGYCGGGCFLVEKFYAKHEDGKLICLWIDFSDKISKEEIDYESLNQEVLDAINQAECAVWEWNDEENWMDDEQLELIEDKRNYLNITNDMGYYFTETNPFLHKLCELSGLTAGPLN